MALSCTALFAVVGLGTAAASEDSSSGKWTLRISQGGPASNFDPALLGSLPQSPAQWATCAKLFNYLDRSGRPRIVPEVAKGMPRVSQDGKAYTFQIRPGFRFNTGAPVRAANFAWAINRDLNPQMGSPAAAYLTDIVGARDVIAGKAKRASGVRAHGEVLTIRLTRRAPDIVQRLGMSYLCSVPTNLPIRTGGVVAPSAGPYFVSHYDPNTVVLEENPYYHGKRPRGPTRIVWSFNQPFDSIPLQVERGDADWGIIAPAATEALAKQYPRQFHRGPGAAPVCLALNSSRPLFHNSTLRKAVSYAIDRRALAAQWGAFAGHVTDHYIPYDMPGYRNEHVYPLKRPNFKKALVLARGHLGAGHAIMYVRSPAPAAFTRAQIVQQDLAKIGITVDIVPPSAQRDASRRGEPFDIVDSGCWLFGQYWDPSSILDASFDGRLIRPTGNTNVAYFTDARFDRKLDAAARLRGRARYRAYGKIDLDLARSAAPAVAYATLNTIPVFVSQRIGCVHINPLFGLSFGALCLKKG